MRIVTGYTFFLGVFILLYVPEIFMYFTENIDTYSLRFQTRLVLIILINDASL